MYVILVGGEMGSGKSTVSLALSKLLHGFKHFEGDDAIPEELSMDSNKNINFFVTRYLLKAIAMKLDDEKSHLIVSYAFYRNEHRQFIIQELSKRGHEAIFLHVSTTSSIQMHNLWRRPKGGRKWIPFAMISRVMAWETPNFPHLTFKHTNGGEKEIAATLAPVIHSINENHFSNLSSLMHYPASRCTRTYVITAAVTLTAVGVFCLNKVAVSSELNDYNLTP